MIVDTAHGHSKMVLDTVSKISKMSKVALIGGNVATGDATKALIDAGANGVKVGLDLVQYVLQEWLLVLGFLNYPQLLIV